MENKAHTTFKTGTSYIMTSIGDSNCHWRFTVLRRTAKTVWLSNDDRSELVTCRVGTYSGAEICSPLGKYSMSPSLSADRETPRPSLLA